MEEVQQALEDLKKQLNKVNDEINALQEQVEQGYKNLAREVQLSRMLAAWRNIQVRWVTRMAPIKSIYEKIQLLENRLDLASITIKQRTDYDQSVERMKTLCTEEGPWTALNELHYVASGVVGEEDWQLGFNVYFGDESSKNYENFERYILQWFYHKITEMVDIEGYCSRKDMANRDSTDVWNEKINQIKDALYERQYCNPPRRRTNFLGDPAVVRNLPLAGPMCDATEYCDVTQQRKCFPRFDLDQTCSADSTCNSSRCEGGKCIPRNLPNGQICAVEASNNTSPVIKHFEGPIWLEPRIPDHRLCKSGKCCVAGNEPDVLQLGGRRAMWCCDDLTQNKYADFSAVCNIQYGVFCPTPKFENLVNGAFPDASSSPTPPSLANDGDIGSFYHSSEQADPFWSINLGGYTLIFRIDIYTPNGYQGYRVRIKEEYSSPWSANLVPDDYPMGLGGLSLITLGTKPLKAVQIRIDAPGAGKKLALSEVEVYGYRRDS